LTPLIIVFSPPFLVLTPLRVDEIIVEHQEWRKLPRSLRKKRKRRADE